MTSISLVHNFFYLGTALVLGAAIGFERQWRQRLAGLRTNTLVALGAASFVVFSDLVTGDVSPTPRVDRDRLNASISPAQDTVPHAGYLWPP